MPCIRYRIILIKIYFDDKKPIEIAKEMNVNRNYFDVLHQRAKNQFKKYYTDN
jgi:DNA-directed RNA polymerase specialized sigma24 family protein